jgi:glycosyltransferase involved in cell wall biosynthesis
MVEPPAPFGNAVSRWYYALLRGLIARGHDVTALATWSKQSDHDEASARFAKENIDLRLFGHGVSRGLAGKWQTLRRPHSYMFHPELVRQLHIEMRRGYDVLHLESLWSGWLGLRADRAVVNVHYLLDLDLPLRAALRHFPLALSFRAERRLLRSYATICTVTPVLANRIRALAPAAEAHVVPLAMDLSLYPFRSQDRGTASQNVGLIGSFDWGPGYDAARRLVARLWPTIRREVPGATLTLVGRNVRVALAGLDLPRDVSIHENVPDAIPYFGALDVMLYAPERGSGTKVKVLEAFALGTPVVTSRHGVEGIAAEDGIHAGVAEADHELVQRTVTLLNRADIANRQRHAARALAEQHCNIPVAIEHVERVHDAVIARGSAGRMLVDACR